MKIKTSLAVLIDVLKIYGLVKKVDIVSMLFLMIEHAQQKLSVKLNQSISVLDKVISSNDAMKIKVEKTFRDTKKQLQSLNKLQNDILLVKNVTEARFAKTWDETKTLVKDSVSFLALPIKICVGLIFLVIFVVLLIKFFTSSFFKSMSNKKRNYNKVFRGDSRNCQSFAMAPTQNPQLISVQNSEFAEA